MDETLRALDILVHQGKVRYIGCCNFAAWQVCRSLWTSDRLRSLRFCGIQHYYKTIFWTVAWSASTCPSTEAEGLGP